MAGGFLGALGAGLTAGGRTFGQLTAEENEQKAQQERMALEQARFMAQQAQQERQFGLQEKQFNASQEERQLENLRKAIENAPPDAQFSPEQFKQATAAGLGQMFKTPQMSFGVNARTGLAGTGLDGGPVEQSTEPAVTANASIQRHMTLPEQAATGNIADAARTRGQEQAFQQWVAANPNATPQQRFQAANQFGQRFTGMSPDEEQKQWQTRNSIEAAQALARTNASAGGRASHANPWFTGFYKNVDDVRAEAQASLTAANATGDETAITAAAQRLQNVEQEAMQRTTKMYGPPPAVPGGAGGDEGGEDITTDVIANIDEDVKRFGGDFGQLKKHVLENQSSLRDKGIDVKAYISAVRSRIPTRTPSQDMLTSAPSPTGPRREIIPTRR